MHQPTAPIIPILNKCFLFVHTPSDPQNPSRRYLQCPATGHLYCTSTGSLYQKTIIPLSANSSPLLSINSGLLPSNPTSCTIKTSSVCTNNLNQQDNGASTSTENNTSPKAKDVKQPIQGNNASMSNTVPIVKNADQQVQGTSAPKTHRNKASKSKVDTTTQVNSPVQDASNFSVCSQSNSQPTAKKEKKKRSRKTKNKSVPILDNSSATPKKKASVSSKKNKSTVTPQPKSTPSFVFIRNSSSNLKKPASITQTANQCKAVIRPDHNLSEKNTKKSHIYYTVYLHHMVKFIQPIRINFEDLLFPQNVFLKHELTKFSRKRAEENTQIIKVCSLSVQKYQCFPKHTRRRKPPSLCTSNEEYFLLCCAQNIFKEKTEKKKKLGPLFQVFKFKTADDILTMIGNDLY
ncbi:uncharacterized protein LOC122935801 [Bufo gargarizans]|uniref:uncharacterized protein LOC122935801 n=1 Tax=Bufo gargarizans TaxID=30331 RepID=UPI001CF196D3|nr:uncharacterized protein LOC122935801 [Bufo gargarizans]